MSLIGSKPETNGCIEMQRMKQKSVISKSESSFDTIPGKCAYLLLVLAGVDELGRALDHQLLDVDLNNTGSQTFVTCCAAIDY